MKTKLKEKIQWVLTIGGFVFGIMGTFRWYGPAGRDGINGKDGINGINGVDGVNGKDGRDGVDGIDGINGVDGLNGLNGIDGEDGRDGVDGKDGKDGSTPYIGENGNWFIDGVDSGVCAVGKDGKDGVDGKDGKDGVDGKDGKDGVDGKDGKDGILYESPTETIVYPTPWIDTNTLRFQEDSKYVTFIRQRKVSPTVFEIESKYERLYSYKRNFTEEWEHLHLGDINVEHTICYTQMVKIKLSINFTTYYDTQVRSYLKSFMNPTISYGTDASDKFTSTLSYTIPFLSYTGLIEVYETDVLYSAADSSTILVDGSCKHVIGEGFKESDYKLKDTINLKNDFDINAYLGIA